MRSFDTIKKTKRKKTVSSNPSFSILKYIDTILFEF
ncbi:hypothetical protein LSS_22955 [Leptospira santarosai serovar Shermani str. LT 821]|uniref:Uncharacterized protein n=1 Tax=Leptospira santarosai serovar Shermani str. LT 821 TaxID=758847 RepID=A0A097ESZ0_9LEPT|nr:hypothetical protein LSS_22955 [Leptospira santarosai serovar Shermani str. LT 821]